MLPSARLIYLCLSGSIVLLSLGLMYWVWTSRRHVRGARAFVAMIGFGGLTWQLVVLTNILSTDPGLQAMAVAGELGAGLLASMLWTTFVSHYTNRNYHRRLWFRTVIAITLVSWAIATVTDPSHHLVFTAITQYQEPFSFASAVRGPLYFVFLGVAYAMLGASSLALFSYISSTRYLTRLRLSLLILGALSIPALNFMTIFDLTPIPEFEHASFGGLPFLLAAAMGLFRLGLLDVSPVARNTLVEALDDAVLVVDDDWRIADFNDRYRTLCPDVDDHVQESIQAACPGLADSIGELLADFYTSHQSNDESVTDEITVRVDGDSRHFSVTISPIRSGHGMSGLDGYSILFRDVTALERSRRELRRQNEQLDRFASAVSHDLRNPLNVADGYVEIARAELQDGNLDETLSHLDVITGAHDRMDDLIDDILALARQGQTLEETTLVDLEGVAIEAWNYVETGDDATVTVETSATIRADRSRLLTVFENLFRNAVEHGSTSPPSQVREDAVEHGSTSPPSQAREDAVEHAGSAVSIEVGTALEDEDGDLHDGAHGLIYVQDDGPGIDPSVATEIFDYGRTTNEAGTGLGLAIVRTVANLHNWTVDVDTSYDDGARFVISGVVFAGEDEVGSTTPDATE